MFVEFEQWKTTIENEQQCSFVKLTGNKKNEKGDVVKYFQCNRGGSYRKAQQKVDGKRSRRLKSQG